jgi:hypothetical protein
MTCQLLGWGAFCRKINISANKLLLNHIPVNIYLNTGYRWVYKSLRIWRKVLVSASLLDQNASAVSRHIIIYNGVEGRWNTAAGIVGIHTVPDFLTSLFHHQGMSGGGVRGEGENGHNV